MSVANLTEHAYPPSPSPFQVFDTNQYEGDALHHDMRELVLELVDGVLVRKYSICLLFLLAVVVHHW
jgi:hypothetical protein